MEGTFHNSLDHLAISLGREARPFLFCARGRSMAPFIIDGDTVEIRPISGNLRTGDVVLLSRGKGFLLHRIITCTEGGVITRGDACSTDDGLAAYDAIVGRAMGVQGKGHNFHLRFPAGYLVALGLGLRKFPSLFGPLRKIAKILLS